MNQKKLFKTILYVSFFLILPNLFFYILSHFIYLKGAFIDIDYLVLGFLIYYIPFPISYLLFVFIFSLDALFAVLPGYHFSDANILRSLQQVLHLDVLNLSLLILCAATILYFVLRWVKRLSSKTGAWSCLLLLLLVLCVDMFLGKKIFHTDFSTSQINNFRNNVMDLRDPKPDTVVGGQMASASDKVFPDLGSGQIPDHVVYIMLESMAQFNEQAANDVQWAAFYDEKILNHYNIQTGMVPFKGSTVPNELREFCRLEINSVNPDLTQVAVESCLIEQFKAHGFRTMSYHGFTGLLFNRLTWYPMLGFDEMLFINDIDRLKGMKRCGQDTYFEAACDETILELIHQQLLDSSQEKVFIYWLTLNTHLPITLLQGSTLECQSSQTTAQHIDACELAQMHDRLFLSLVDVMMDPRLPPTMFVLVGDHAPPFMSVDVRATVDPHHVPFMILRPKK